MLTKENGFTLPVNINFPESKKYFFTFIALLAAIFIIYSNSFYGEWHFDDFGNIVNNPYIQMKSFSWSEIKHCITVNQKKLWRPLPILSFALNHKLGGLDVFGFHVVNFIIHYFSSIFLFLFIYNTLKLPRLKDQYENIAYPMALLATFFWALNPVMVTSVTYIVQGYRPWRDYFISCPCIFISKAELAIIQKTNLFHPVFYTVHNFRFGRDTFQRKCRHAACQHFFFLIYFSFKALLDKILLSI